MAPIELQEQKPMTFEFITVQNPTEGRSAKIRTKVKRHVMKDIGYSRRRPKKNPVVLDVVLDPRNQVGSNSTDPFVTYAHDLNDDERGLIRYIFEDTFDNPQRAYRNEWFPLGQIDSATLDLILANAAAHREQALVVAPSQRSLFAEKYHVQALQSLNKRLADPDLEITDGLIGSVTGFVVHNEIIADFEQWAIHHAGLVRLLNMRGGIDSITFRPLRETISWIEIRGCYAQDRRPFFPPPASWVERIQPMQRQLENIDVPEAFAAAWRKLAPSSGGTYASYENLHRFSYHTGKVSQATQKRVWLKDEYAGNWVTLVLHSLVSRYGHPQNSKTKTPPQEALRLASLLYLANVWRKYGVSPVRTQHMANKLLNIHIKYSHQWQSHWQIQGWTLLMGVIQSSGQTRCAFGERLCKLAQSRNISVSEIILLAKKVLWLPEVFPSVDDILLTESVDWTMRVCLRNDILAMAVDSMAVL